jgi:hypothetical protein
MIEIVVLLIVCVCIVCIISSVTGTGIGAYLYTSVDGEWSEWTDGDCDLDCGGERIRTRKCDNPEPSGNGLDCEGNDTQVVNCSACVTQEDIKEDAEKTAIENEESAKSELEAVAPLSIAPLAVAKTQVIPYVGKGDGEFFDLQCPENSYVTEINGSYRTSSLRHKRYIRDFGIKCSNGQSISSPVKNDSTATLFSYKRNNGFDKMTINAGGLVDGTIIDGKLAGGSGGIRNHKQCSNGRMTGFSGTIRSDNLLSSLGIVCNNTGEFSSGNINFSTSPPTGSVPMVTGGPLEIVEKVDEIVEKVDEIVEKVDESIGCVKYGDKIHIAKSANGAYRLKILHGKAYEVLHDISEGTQLVIQSTGEHGCVKYGDKIHIAKSANGAYRLKTLQGNAYEVRHDISEGTQFRVQSADGKFGNVKYGDKIHIAKSANGAYRLKILHGKAYEVRHDISEGTQLSIQLVN